MPAFSIKKAKDGGILSDKELERFACLYMICQDRIKPTNDEWQKAVDDLGGTIGSFKFAVYNAMKKLRDKDCFTPTEESKFDVVSKKKNARDKKRSAEEDGEGTGKGKVVKKDRQSKRGVVKQEPDDDSKTA